MSNKITAWDLNTALQKFTRSFVRDINQRAFAEEKLRKELELKKVGLDENSMQYVEEMLKLDFDQQRRLGRMAAEIESPDPTATERKASWSQQMGLTKPEGE